MEETFETIHKEHFWFNPESKSGSGSTKYQTRIIREAIVALVAKYDIKSFFDVPCGDFNWFQHIVGSIPNYIGGDIVSGLIKTNVERFSNIQFIHFDITSQDIPDTVDLVFSRDVLPHFSLGSILKVFQTLKKSKARYFLTTTFLNRKFKEIKDGDWRPISLFDAPFCFPIPIELINEQCTEMFPNYVDKSLALWNISDIPNFIPLKIFRTWHDKEKLPAYLANAVDSLKEKNPEFEHHLFDLKECEDFIEKYFDARTLSAYRSLLPLAYKADLWRLCVLYIYGGIYIDISFRTFGDFKLIELIRNEWFSKEVRLHPYGGIDDDKGVSNGFMVCYPRNTTLLATIHKIVDNVENKYYGLGIYDITGAVVLGSFFTKQEKQRLPIKRVTTEYNGYSLYDRQILVRIQDYDSDKSRIIQEYNTCWYGKTVFSS